MDDRARIAKLLRRFCLGVQTSELDRLTKLGFEKAKAEILNPERTDEKFPISFWEFAKQDDGKIESNSFQVRPWWAVRMLMTKRPSQEKLTLFWHDHFAVDVEKIYEAPIMVEYLDVLRSHGMGKFRDLLMAVFKQGALLAYLDNHTSNRIHPNENFAREALELFSMGEGNYSEKDVQELARAFTGWSFHYAGFGLEIPYEKLRERMNSNKMAVANVCYVPALHDDGEKTILGKTGKFGLEEAVDLLAAHPATAKTITEKLWNFYAGFPPSAKVQENLISAWKKSDGEIRSVLAAILNQPEFWTPEHERSVTKSPVDWSVGLFRSFDLGDTILQLRGNPKDEFTAVKKEVREAGNGLTYLMDLQGLRLLFPPDVGGWTWGSAWLTTENIAQRLKHSDVIFWGGGNDRPFAMMLANKIKQQGKSGSVEEIVDAVLEHFDVPEIGERKQALFDLATKRGGVKALEKPDSAAYLFAQLSRNIFAIPEFQLC